MKKNSLFYAGMAAVGISLASVVGLGVQEYQRRADRADACVSLQVQLQKVTDQQRYLPTCNLIDYSALRGMMPPTLPTPCSASLIEEVDSKSKKLRAEREHLEGKLLETRCEMPKGYQMINGL